MTANKELSASNPSHPHFVDALSHQAVYSWSKQGGFASPGLALSDGVAVVISAPALSGRLLDQILRSLSEWVEVEQIASHPLSEVLGDSVVVVQVNDEQQHLNPARLSNIAAQFHVDIAGVSERPALSEGGLLVMDMDSTIIQIECIDEIAALAGLKEQVSAVTEKAMRGEIPFSESLIQRVACLKGVPVSQLASIRDSIPLMPGLTLLLNTLKAHNWKIAIASGGFTYFADYLKDRLGLDEAVSNTLGIQEDMLTGKVSGAIVDAQVKADTVKALAQRWHIPAEQTIAMGDGANDLLMMDAAALGVACHAKPKVTEQADAAIRFGGLHTLLYLLR